jgi:hypothetical protein
LTERDLVGAGCDRSRVAKSEMSAKPHPSPLVRMVVVAAITTAALGVARPASAQASFEVLHTFPFCSSSQKLFSALCVSKSQFSR